MKKQKKNLVKKILVVAAILIIMAIAAVCSGFEPASDKIVGTVWALIPSLIAIILALVTKEVYSSLFVGIVAGALFYNGFHPIMTMNMIMQDGFIACLADSWNVGILIFLVELGTLVALINKAGGSRAYGNWASRKIKTKRAAMAATFGLGALIFVDDYFNCLTVGSVMRPISDRNKISRAKLAYIIDATAAPICMIAPISSWAAAVSGLVEGYNGLELFVKAIPYNFYSILTIVMLLFLTITNLDFGLMRLHEENAQKGDLYTTPDRPYEKEKNVSVSSRGGVIDLVIPIAVLIVGCITCMIYTGGFFEGTSFVDAFAGCDASVGLSLGAMIALLVTIVLYLVRRVITFHEIMDCFPSGFNSMVPAILILSFAWTLCGMTKSLEATRFVEGIMNGSAAGFANFLPAIIFVVALFLAFSTGTSWGTFSILIPIVASVFMADESMLIIATSACLAGAVCGDHCSPISDTTIMASSGAQCNHINHVETQLPYALTVAAVSFASYIIAGFVRNVYIVLPIAVVCMIATLYVINKVTSKEMSL